MNIDIKTLFPRGSTSFYAANPAIVGQTPQPTARNPVQGNVERKKGNPWPLEEFDYETDYYGKIQDSEPQHHQTPALDSTDAGEAESVRGTVVSFTGYRVRPLDPDNFAGSCKDLLDGIVHAGLVFDDAPWCIVFKTRQRKVKTFAEEKTVIEIWTPNDS